MIQAAMGWEDCHLHAFEVGGRRYAEKGSLEDTADEGRLRLKALIESGVSKFTYTYNFGDNWEHVVTIENGLPAVEGEISPHCVAGRRACPPEDCGGVWGYEELIAILADPEHPDHDEKRAWLETDFDPERFDIKAANAKIVASLGRPFPASP